MAKIFFLIIILIIILIILICLLSAVLDSSRFVTVSYELRSDKIAKPCRMVLLSDLHNKSFGRDNERLVQKITELSPDAVLVAGDMLTATKGHDFDRALRLMERLAGGYKIYYGMGNHEHRLQLYPDQYPGMYEGYLKGLCAAGIEPLINESTYLPAWNVAVCGVQIDRCYYKHLLKEPMESDYLPRILGEASKDAFQVLIAHNPAYFEDYVAWGADLVVSGHVHGGIMRLPVLGGVLSPSLTLFPKYDGGRFTCGKSTMILSRGLGSHTIPLRIFNPGELVVIELLPDGQ
ncbi:MAG: metallophosphoesterase [Lachnospiraceae bacterium]|nr:metallophosphoesterase [Lachnospiraceae bacterium]